MYGAGRPMSMYIDMVNYADAVSERAIRGTTRLSCQAREDGCQCLCRNPMLIAPCNQRVFRSSFLLDIFFLYSNMDSCSQSDNTYHSIIINIIWISSR